MKQTFTTSVGIAEILLDEESGIVSLYRFDAEGRPIAAAIENWDHPDLANVLHLQAGIPEEEARDIATAVRKKWSDDEWTAARAGAGIPIRFIAALIDAVVVFVPLGILLRVYSNSYWLLLALPFAYYIDCQALTGTTVGKHFVGIPARRRSRA